VLARLWNTFDFPFEFGIAKFPELLLNVFGARVMKGCKLFGQHPNQYIRYARHFDQLLVSWPSQGKNKSHLFKTTGSRSSFHILFIETITTIDLEMEIDAMTSPTLSIAHS